MVDWFCWIGKHKWMLALVGGSQLKKALFNMPNRIVRDIMLAPTETEAMNIFKDELNQVCDSFLKLKPGLL